VLKYKVEFKSSRLLVFFQLLTYLILVLSVLNWQHDIVQYQFFLQIVIMLIITFFVFRAILHGWHQTQASVILSQSGEWLEINIDRQVAWRITNKSRISSVLLFIRLVSPLNARHSKWCLIYKDQVSERDFRRLCRTVIHQQQSAVKD
jgi:hypothetical protein